MTNKAYPHPICFIGECVIYDEADKENSVKTRTCDYLKWQTEQPDLLQQRPRKTYTGRSTGNDESSEIVSRVEEEATNC